MELKITRSEIEPKIMDHHSFVLVVCQDLKIDDKLNQEIGSQKSKSVIKGLGYTIRRLYLIVQCSHGKATAYLFDKNVTDDSFNDHILNKALDEMKAHGSAKPFSKVAFEIAHEQSLPIEKNHHNTTRFSLIGRYKNSSEDNTEMIKVLQGYPTHRSDLKGLTKIGKAISPIWMAPQNSNSSFKKRFHRSMMRIRVLHVQLKDEHNFIWDEDSTLYGATYLFANKNHHRISQLTENISEAKGLLERWEGSLSWTGDEKGYQYTSQLSGYDAIRRHWLPVFSKQTYEQEKKTFDKRLAKQEMQPARPCWYLKNKIVSLKQDALSALKPLKMKFRYFNLNASTLDIKKHELKKHPKKRALNIDVGYKVLIQKEASGVLKRRFILATNDLDEARLSNHKMLLSYQEQARVEDGFAFSKDVWFILYSLYLKNSQHNIITKVLKNKEPHPKQKDKNTVTSTIKCIFHSFEDVSIARLANQYVMACGASLPIFQISEKRLFVY